jgi:hypothetical protein
MKASNIIIIPLLIIQIAGSKEPTQHGFGLEKKLQDAEDALSSDLEYVEQHMSWSSIFYVNHRELQQTDDDIFEKYNTRCHKESDCGDSIFLHCHRKDGHKICMHKPIFPMHESEILGTVVLTVLMALAVISGIGGGGIIVSLLMVFYKLNTKEAIAVSGFTIFSGSIARFLITINKRHPHKDAPVIDYSLANIMLPTVLVGSLFGVFLNLLLPSLVLQIFLSIVLALLAVQSGFKAVHIYQQESMDEKNNEQLEEPKQQNIN